MNEEELKEEFVKQCVRLQNSLLIIFVTEEPSPRVWMSVMCEFMKNIILTQNNPSECFAQLKKKINEVGEELINE